jgi:MFS family permease
MYLTAPFLYVVVHRYHRYRKMMCLSGFGIMIASLVGASFANTVSQLLVTQGVFYAIGGAMLYFPVFNYVDEWFIKRRGLAYGALIAGDGAGGVVIPFVMEWILSRWGYQTALRTWTIICLPLVSLALVFLKDYPVAQNDVPASRNVDMRFLRSKAFWILISGNMLQSLGYFLPSYYLPCKQITYHVGGLLLIHQSQRSQCPAAGLQSQALSRYLYAMQQSCAVL